MQQLLAAIHALQAHFDQEATGIHSGYQQEGNSIRIICKR